MSIKITQEKQEIVNKLESLEKRLSEIENQFSIDFSELINKVKQACNNVKEDIFSIAFFGAFSDGKSTILSVLLNRLDIKISPEPTTDKITPYTYEDYKIIDTPGLFSENLRHDALTKKYISEANIVIYTVDPVNPLKESHLPIVRWILSDLNKIDSTIFVINKMDEVADLEDDDDYNRNSEIKKEVVVDILKEELGIENANKIVCVAADPFEKGLEFWRENNSDYLRLSRIDMLENQLSGFTKKYKNELVVKAGLSVIRDASVRVCLELDEIKGELETEAKLLKNQIEEYESRMKTLGGDIHRSYINIKNDFIALRDDLLVELNSVDNMAQLADVLQKRLGKEGYIMEEKIDLIISKHTGNLISGSKKIFESLEESLVYHSQMQNELMGKLSETGKSVIKGMLSGPTRKIADAVIKTRDVLKLPFKFKPWGAVKFAKFLKAMPVVIDILSVVVDIVSAYKMNKKREEVKKEIEDGFKNLIETVNKETYTETYFPYFLKTRDILDSVVECKNEIQDSIANISNIKIEINNYNIY